MKQTQSQCAAMCVYSREENQHSRWTQLRPTTSRLSYQPESIYVTFVFGLRSFLWKFRTKIKNSHLGFSYRRCRRDSMYWVKLKGYRLGDVSVMRVNDYEMLRKCIWNTLNYPHVLNYNPYRLNLTSLLKGCVWKWCECIFYFGYNQINIFRLGNKK